MRQLTLAHQAEFQRYSKKTRREQFLEEMDAVMPWAELLALVEPHYPKGEQGRKPVGLAIMLRVYFLQHWFALSDPAVEDALYESGPMRRFAGIDLGRAPAPDETTILNFRPSAGSPRFMRADARYGQPLSGQPRHPHHDWHDR
jgi:IS5 family transposase